MAISRFDLTEYEWSVIQPPLPNKPRGVSQADDRRVLNGMFWRLRTVAPWADIPARYGPQTTCMNRFNRWRKAGVWGRLVQAVSEAYDGDVQMIDSSSIRVHHHAANTQKKSDRSRCMGRSRGGLATRVHVVVGANDLPITLKLTNGQAYDRRSGEDTLDTAGPSQALLADRAYDSDALRQRLTERGGAEQHQAHG